MLLPSLSAASSWLLSTLLLSVSDSDSALREKNLSTAKAILKAHPLVDGHVDLPVVLRLVYGGDLDNVQFDGPVLRRVDLPRLRKGGVGGFFSIAYTPCPDETGNSPGFNFTDPTHDVRDTLEQIDMTHQLQARYPKDLGLASSVQSVKQNFQEGKVSLLIGIEGAHGLGVSLSTLRQYYLAGVRYLTLTHTCHNVFADSCSPPEPLHGGLSPYGRRLIKEMNRLGMLVDVSHTSDDTARQAIETSDAPIVFSHSGARAIHDHPRNVPDDVLKLLGKRGGKDGLVMANFLSVFVGTGKTTVSDVADHVEHIASIVGRARVGLGSDYDGGSPLPDGLEDISDYPNLLAELLRRGWSHKDLVGLIGGNFLRILGKAEKVAHDLRERKADMRPYELRPDLGKGKKW